MKATEILISEHLVIERVITALEIAAICLEKGGDVRPSFFVDAADFIKGFADGCHHKKEENVLFKAMAENGVPMEGGPVGMMLYEHAQGRTFTRLMREAVLKLADDPTVRERVVENALGYTSLLREHIKKENQILFPMADRLVSPKEQEQVAEGFEQVEHEETGEGVHEKYLALANALEREAANLKTEA